MGDFSKPRESAAENVTRDLYPMAHCTKCGADSSIALYDVVNKHTGKTVRGPGSDFSMSDKSGNCTGMLRPGLRLERSLGFCADCFLGEPKRTSTPATEEVAEAWQWMMDQWPLDALDLSHPKAERFLEICNRQARETGDASAIPPHCRLPGLKGRAA